MAQYTPKGWTASPDACKRFKLRYVSILRLVQQKARKYFNLYSIATSDLVQEGLIAALYAVDSFKPERGKLDAYIGTTVNNAMMMIVAESRAQCRQPYTWVQVDDDETAPPAIDLKKAAKPADTKHKGWRRVPAVPDHDACEKVLDTERMMPTEEREAEIERLDKLASSRARLAAVRRVLGSIARRVFDVRVEPPPEVFIIARNQAGRLPSENVKLPTKAIACYLGISEGEVERAQRDIKAAVIRAYPERVRREVLR